MLLVLLTTLLGVSSSIRADFAQGKEAYDLGEYAEAWQELLPLADGGHAEAQIIVGHMYNQGNGVNADLPRAAAYYERAAVRSNARAQALLAFHYSTGRGVELDHERALHWYLQAASQGDAYAQLDLARMYKDGRGVVRDYVQAYKWYIIAGLHDDICDCLLDGRDVIAAEMTGKEIQRAEKLALEWYPPSRNRIVIFPVDR